LAADLYTGQTPGGWSAICFSALDPAQIKTASMSSNGSSAMISQKRLDKALSKALKYPPRTDIIKTQPSYFNTGCCRFKDGDITGIEIEDGQIRLIKWGGEDENIARTIFEQTHLSEVFFFL
jgi:hypothetical protein